MVFGGIVISSACFWVPYSLLRTAFVPSWCGMLRYRDLTSMVARV